MTPANQFPGNIVFYVLFLAFVGFFLYSASTRLRVIFAGRWRNLFDHIPQRLLFAVPNVAGNFRVARRRYWYSGLLHTMILWGFIVLQVRTLNFLLAGLHEDASLQSILGDGYTYFRPVMDLFNVLVIAGVAMAAFQRFVWRPARLTLNWDAWTILGLLAFLMITDVLTNSFEIALHRGDKDGYAFLAYGVAELWDGIGMSVGTQEALHTTVWYAHLVDFLVFLCYLPYSKHSHILTIPFNAFFKSTQPTGILQPIDMEAAMASTEEVAFGAGKLQDFTWKQLLDSYTCTECGRCTAACPANATGKALSPKQVIVDIRHLAEEQTPPLAPWTKRPAEPTPLIDAVGFDPIWDCVTCGACMEECPVFIEHVPTIMDMRRHLVMTEARMPETAQSVLMNLEQRDHPWRGTAYTRTTWIEEMAQEGVDVPFFDGSQEYLYWVGCTGALQERNVKVTKAVVRLLLEAKVDFGVLGPEEGCSGDPARRLGNEYLFQMQAQRNIETFKAKGIRKIVSNCPHCFNTMRHEYPQFDGHFEVTHHSEFFARLVDEGRLRPGSLREMGEKLVTYHDPCYIARHNDLLEEPRQLLASAGAKMVEMPRCKRGTFCCGAGGSHMWVEESQGQRINHVRTEEAAETGADIIAVACPFCMQMFEDGLGAAPQAAEREMQVLDIAEMIEVAALDRQSGSPPAGGA